MSMIMHALLLFPGATVDVFTVVAFRKRRYMSTRGAYVFENGIVKLEDSIIEDSTAFLMIFPSCDSYTRIYSMNKKKSSLDNYQTMLFTLKNKIKSFKLIFDFFFLVKENAVCTVFLLYAGRKF